MQSIMGRNTFIVGLHSAPRLHGGWG